MFIQLDFGFRCPTNQMHIQILRSQCIAQGFRFLTPLIIQAYRHPGETTT